MPRVTPPLGTRSSPLASYLGQCAQLQKRGLAVPWSGCLSDRCMRRLTGLRRGHRRGGEAEVDTPNGQIKLNIPAGTQPEQVFRLAGRGMPHLKTPATKGDLFVKLKVQIPKYLSSKQIELIEEASRIKF